MRRCRYRGLARCCRSWPTCLIGTPVADGVWLRVFAHPSSASLACARLGWALDSVPVISVLGRPVAVLARYLAPGRRLLVLSTDENSPYAIRDLITEFGYAESRVWVLQDLGAAGERIDHGIAATINGEFAALNIVAIECADGPVRGSFGISDKAYAHDGQLTKRDLRAVTIARLAPSYGQLLWDVGAGSGSIGIEWLRSAPSARAVAIERDAVRAERVSGNASALGVPALRVVCAAAPAAFADLETPDAVFIGGGLTVPGVLTEAWQALRAGGRLVANAVTVESEALLLRWFSEVGGELTRIGISHAEPIGGFTGWRPAMPITQWTAVKP
jgi:precorrin-6Y C5,15-methyltransferase (decarboxylating)